MIGMSNIYDEWAVWCMRVHGRRAVDFAQQGYAYDAAAEARAAASEAIYFLRRWEEEGKRRMNWNEVVV